ncbi:MAG: TonB-dependent receptor plug domain-containing protein [Luteitalea sp.]|nr:TonB-dependent receptor plug domain-containing protein [Luteitalea sp.]
MVKRFLIVVCAATMCAALMGTAPPAWAQGTTSRIGGAVTDASGGAIPGATVTLTNESTGVSFTTVTSGTGVYVFEAVGVGTYTVKVELDGFKTFVAPGSVVNIGGATTVNAELEAGSLTETVEVIAAAPAVQTTDSGNYGSVIDQRSVESLPIIGGRGRNPLNLVLTQPGVVSGANTGGGTHVHGARDRAWNYTLDGIDTNESSAGGAETSPLKTNPDALAEFKVLTGNFTADYGRNSGGQVAMVSRSGTNEFHGTGFYFARRPQFNANEWENNFSDLPKAEERLNIGGFSFGGPIRRSKTFFFGNLQILRGQQQHTRTRNVYTESVRQGIWRYVPGAQNQPAGVGGASVDSAGNPIVGVVTYNIATNDPRGIGLDPQVQGLIDATPLPNDFSVGDGLNLAGYTWNPEETEEQHDVLLRVDQVLSPKHYAFARVAWGQQNTLCDEVNDGTAPFPDVSCTVDTERRPFNVAASWRWNPVGSVVNELVVGGNHFTFDFVTPEAQPGLVDFVPPREDIDSTNRDTADIMMPRAVQLGNARTINTYQVVNNTSWLRGAHTIKGGLNLRYQQHKDTRGSIGSANANPIVNFDPAVSTVDPTVFGLPNNIQLDNDLPALQRSVNFLLGRVGTIEQGFVQQGDGYAPGGTPFDYDARFPELDLYLQDNWKIRPNITIDAGLRWELKMAPSNPENRILRPDQRVAVGEAASNSLTWVEESLYDHDINNLAPSVGVAWDPQNDGKNVIRGNYRVAYDRINTFLLSSVIFQSIPGITRTETNTEFGQNGGRLPNLPTLQPTGQPEDFVTPPPVSNSSIHVMDTEFEAPLTHGWAASYQRELWGKSVLEVAYIGRRGQNLFGAYNVNQAEIQDNGFLDAFNTVKAGGQSALLNQLMGVDSRLEPGQTGSDLMRQLFSSELSRNSVAGVADALAERVQGSQTLSELAGLGPYFFYAYPQFLGGMNVIDSNDRSTYHALEITWQRRFGSGFGYLLGYTLSQSKDTRSFDPAFTRVSTGSNQSASSTPFDIHNRELNFAPSDFDRTHVFQGSFVTELPFGRGKPLGGDAGPALDALIGGWQIAGILRYYTGRPFTVYSGANTLSNVVQTPANCAGCSSSAGSVFPEEDGIIWYFNGDERAGFSGPDAGAFSDAGRNFFRGPGSFNADLSVTKRFSLFGAHSVEYRLDITNLTNTPTFDFPTAVTTDPTFGRIRDDVLSFSRRIQMGLKYTF